MASLTRPDRRDRVVEFTGLPGSGKTTVAEHFPASWMRCNDVKGVSVPWQARASLMRESWRFFLSLRPHFIKDLRKFWRLTDELVYYTHEFGRPLVIDQGIVQKLWATLVWRSDFDRGELERVVRCIAPVSPDLIVWMRTPLEEALRRMASRPNGTSRFDKRPPDETREELAREERHFELLVELFRRHAGTTVIEFSGKDDPQTTANAVMARVAVLGNDVRTITPGA